MWSTEHGDSTLGDLSILVQSKSMPDSSVMPKELYLTHMYKLVLKCSGTLATMEPLTAQVILINSTTKEEITKDNQSTITGTTKTDIKLGEGILKIKFTDTSYHHGKSDFNLKITLFGSVGGTGLSPLLSKISPSFKVYSKKKRTGWTKESTEPNRVISPSSMTAPTQILNNVPEISTAERSNNFGQIILNILRIQWG